MSARPHVVVVGGGIAGLACAHALVRSAANGGRPRVTLLEADKRLGGKIRSETLAGQTVDVGAESLLTRTPAAVELCDRLGLGEELLAPDTTATSVWTRKRLRQLPPGVLGGLPDGVLPLLRSGILSPAGVARASLDLVLPSSSEQGDRSVADLIGKRLGRQALDRLVDPLLGTIYAASCDTLSLRATAPQFEAIAREHRSLIRGLRSGGGPASSPPPGPPFATLPGGLERIVAKISEELRAGEVAEVRQGTPARLLTRTAQGGYSLVLSNGERLTADAAVIATPALQAAEILAAIAPKATDELRGIGYLSTVLVTLRYPAKAAPGQPPYAGILVPRGERRLLGACTSLSSKWPHLGATGELWLRCSIARSRVEWALGAEEDELVAEVGAELGAALGLRGAPSSAHVTRWRNALPHYEPGHLDRVARIERALEPFGGLALAGAAYRGMGVPQCIAQGSAAAERVLAAARR